MGYYLGKGRKCQNHGILQGTGKASETYCKQLCWDICLSSSIDLTWFWFHVFFCDCWFDVGFDLLKFPPCQSCHPRRPAQTSANKASAPRPQIINDINGNPSLRMWEKNKTEKKKSGLNDLLYDAPRVWTGCWIRWWPLATCKARTKNKCKGRAPGSDSGWYMGLWDYGIMGLYDIIWVCPDLINSYWTVGKKTC